MLWVEEGVVVGHQHIQHSHQQPAKRGASDSWEERICELDKRRQLDLPLLTDEAVERADAALVVQHDLLDGALPSLVGLRGQLPLLLGSSCLSELHRRVILTEY